eukprot:TRINITY_DN13154_c0_g1_i5.p1 TRINITY_DN13154_c0_g1~~TRINITY_DN13154_c0_g1_i5.p1  ORF type:complete len:330 (+),score=75.98 TRINITY_DN13154_c0_g1_i5:44-991(+)
MIAKMKTEYKDNKKKSLYILGCTIADSTPIYSLFYVGTTTDTVEQRVMQHSKGAGAILFKTANHADYCENCRTSKNCCKPTSIPLYTDTSKSELDEDLVTCALLIAFGEKYVFGGRLASSPYKRMWIEKLSLKTLGAECMQRLTEQLLKESNKPEDGELKGFLHFLYIGSSEDTTTWLLTQEADLSPSVANTFQDSEIENCFVFVGSTSKIEMSAKVAVLKYYLKHADVCGGKYWHPTSSLSCETEKIMQEYNNEMTKRLLNIPFCYWCKKDADHFTSEHGKKAAAKENKKEEKKVLTVEELTELVSDLNMEDAR